MNTKVQIFYSLLFALLCTTSLVQAQVRIDGKTALGVWKNIDDKTGEAESYVEIYQKGSKYYGKVTQILKIPKLFIKEQKLQANDFEKVTCTKCPDAYGGKTQKMLGLVFLKDMESNGKKYNGGVILDPKDGQEYTCTMWLEDADTLKVRGWWGFLYRTQTWKRMH